MSERPMLMIPKLKPLKVPWMLSPSVPFLQLVAQEGSPGHSVAVQFVAYDKRLEKDSENRAPGKVHVARPLSEFRPFDGPVTKPYRQIRMCFPGEAYAKVSPAFSDCQVIDESCFDWSDVPGRWEPGEDIFDYMRRQDRLWHQTGICPNPRIYQIEDSHWVRDASFSGDPSPRLNHYIILGHDLFVEVIASDYIVIGGQMLDDW
jgi:hypothetical protein